MKNYFEAIRLNEFYRHLDEFVNSVYFHETDLLKSDVEELIVNRLAMDFDFYDRCIMLDKDNIGEGDPAYTIMYCAVKYVMKIGLRKDKLMNDIILATAYYYNYINDPKNCWVTDVMAGPMYIQLDDSSTYIATLLLHFIDNPKWKKRFGDFIY